MTPGTRAIVTGAGKGLGRAISLALLEAGCRMALFTRTGSDLDDLAGSKAIPADRILTGIGDVAEAVLYVARQPDRLFVKEIELRITPAGKA